MLLMVLHVNVMDTETLSLALFGALTTCWTLDSISQSALRGYAVTACSNLDALRFTNISEHFIFINPVASIKVRPFGASVIQLRFSRGHPGDCFPGHTYGSTFDRPIRQEVRPGDTRR